MKRTITFTALLILVGCSNEKNSKIDNQKIFTAELVELKEYFKIPGITAIIEEEGQIIYENYLGHSEINSQTEVDSTTLFPIASLTKIFSGILAMKLEEQGEISLDDPINMYLPNSTLNDSILIKHVLSHTSQGEIGNQFYYSSRFGLLAQVFEKATNKTLEKLMEEELFKPLNLNNTFLLKDSAQVSSFGKRFASPYVLDNGIEKGFVDYGYSTSAGIVTNAHDLLILSRALDSSALIKPESKSKMLSPFKNNLPYGYGIFSQSIDGMDVIWAYGQYDCYSSLFLKVPSKNLTLVLLANNNLMSDPARLIYGNVYSSLFALSFMKNYVLSSPETKLFQNPDSLIFNKNPKFIRDLVLAQALSESFLARFEPNKVKTSAALLEKIFQEYPDYLEYADLNLLHNLTFLKDVAFYMDLGKFNKFDTQIEQIGEKLLKETPSNPYVHSYLGTYHDRKGNVDKAELHFRGIIDAPNFSQNWYTTEAKQWLNDHE